MSDLGPLADISLAGFFGVGQQALKRETARQDYMVKCRTLGVADTEAQAILDAAQREYWDGVWSGDPVAEAWRMVLRVYVERRPLPSPEVREAARRALALGGLRFTPEDVDRLADAIERFGHQP